MCRVKQAVLDDFAAQAQTLLVPDSGWTTKAAEADLTADIDSHIERIIASKAGFLHPLETLTPHGALLLAPSI